MDFFDDLFGKRMTNAVDGFDHAVIIHFTYGMEDLDPLFTLEETLEQVITANDLGRHDGHEIAMDNSDGFLYMYGRNAETLFKGIQKTLRAVQFMQGASVLLRFGPPDKGVKEIEFSI